eukprot:364336-Lingulodinium_polyedra.AAC.1
MGTHHLRPGPAVTSRSHCPSPQKRMIATPSQPRLVTQCVDLSSQRSLYLRRGFARGPTHKFLRAAT